jgi:WhiB family redox-sensing transcriptional regulator
MSVPTYTTGGDPVRDGLLDLFGEVAWQDRGLCAQTDPEAFFPVKGQPATEAKRVCASCEVKAECLEWALEYRQTFGVWGGLTPTERKKLQRKRSASVSPAAAATTAMEEVIRLGMKTVDIEKRFGVSERTVYRTRERLADKALKAAA